MGALCTKGKKKKKKEGLLIPHPSSFFLFLSSHSFLCKQELTMSRRFSTLAESSAKRLHRDIVIEKPMQFEEEEDHTDYTPVFNDEAVDYNELQEENLARQALTQSSKALKASQQAVQLMLNPEPVGIEKVCCWLFSSFSSLVVITCLSLFLSPSFLN